VLSIAIAVLLSPPYDPEMVQGGETDAAC